MYSDPILKNIQELEGSFYTIWFHTSLYIRLIYVIKLWRSAALLWNCDRFSPRADPFKMFVQLSAVYSEEHGPVMGGRVRVQWPELIWWWHLYKKPLGWLWVAVPAAELLHFSHAQLAGMSAHWTQRKARPVSTAGTGASDWVMHTESLNARYQIH